MSDLETIIIGIGGVGCIVAYGIEYTKKSNVSIVVRRDYEKVIKEGYEIDSCDYGKFNWKPKNIYKDIEAAAASGKEFDYIVVTTKSLPDIIKTEDLIEPLVSKKSTIVLMQNGFDLGRPFFKKYPENVIVSGVSHIGSHNSGGVIHQTQNDKSLVSYFESPSIPLEIQEKKTKDFIDIYSNDKNNCSYFPDGKWYRYRKLVYNATLNTTCALTVADTAINEYAGGLDAISIPAMKEVIAIAKADGVELPDDVINLVCHSDDGDYFLPSMCVDVKKGNPIELESILGNLLVRGKELKVATPILDTLYSLLKVVQYKLKVQNGYITLPEKRPITDRIYQ